MVTAELALGFVAVLAALGMALTVVSLGVDQVRCVDAAGVAARAMARGDGAAAAQAAAQRVAPGGSSVRVSSGGGWATATVVAAPPRLRLLPIGPASASASVPVEQ